MRMEKRDKIPIPKEHRQHARRVLEIVLTKLSLEGRVHEKELSGSGIELSVVEGSGPQRTFPASAPITQQLLSQLPFESDMLEVTISTISLTNLSHLCSQ